MHKKLFCMTVALMIGSMAFAMNPDITHSGTFYIYSFFWQNGDFNSDFDDGGDQFFYMHADLGLHADFGSGITTQLTVGGWGTFGVHPITGEGAGDTPGQDVALREAYLDVAELFDAPLAFRAGMMHVYYPGQVFDGGEDGVMGLKFYGATDMLDYDIAWYRLVENGGCWCAGMGPVADDRDLFGVYLTGKFVESAVRLSPYWFWRTQNTVYEDTLALKDDPMWIGGRLDVGPIAGLALSGEFTMMLGKAEIEDVMTSDYAGMHYMGKLSYTPPTLPVMLGGGYYVFTGDDATTDENELYESPIWGPYTNDLYKWWPGFGPAHVLKTTFGFTLLAPFDLYSTNLAVINGNLGFHQGPFTVRADFYKYSRNWVAEGDEDDMGMEIALLTTYTYKKKLTFGGTVGYWMPGDYFTPNEDAMLGGYLFTYLSF